MGFDTDTLMVFDCETGGKFEGDSLDPAKGRMFQMAGVILDKATYEEKFRFNYRIAQPPNFTPWDAKSLPDLTPVSEPQALDLLDKIHAAFKPKFCAWNVGFDWGFVSAMYARHSRKNPFNYHLLDIPSVAWTCGFEERLENILPKLGITNEKAHDAMADAMAEVEVLRRLVRMPCHPLMEDLR